MPPDQVILSIIGIVVFLFFVYYVMWFISKRATGQTRVGLKNRNITLLDRYAIARDKQFCIIEIAGKVYIVGVTNHTMTLLDTIDAAEFAGLTEDYDESATPWNMTPVGQYGNKLTKMVVAFIAEKTGKNKQSSKATAEEETVEEETAEEKAVRQPFADSLKEAERTADDTEKKAESGQAELSDYQIKIPEEDD